MMKIFDSNDPNILHIEHIESIIHLMHKIEPCIILVSGEHDDISFGTFNHQDELNITAHSTKFFHGFHEPFSDVIFSTNFNTSVTIFSFPILNHNTSTKFNSFPVTNNENLHVCFDAVDDISIIFRDVLIFSDTINFENFYIGDVNMIHVMVDKGLLKIERRF